MVTHRLKGTSISDPVIQWHLEVGSTGLHLMGISEGVKYKVLTILNTGKVRFARGAALEGLDTDEYGRIKLHTEE